MTAPSSSVASDARTVRQCPAGGEPILVSLHPQAETAVKDAQIAVLAAHHGIGPDRFDLLRHYADIALMAAIVGEAVEAKPIVETAEQFDIMLEPDVG